MPEAKGEFGVRGPLNVVMYDTMSGANDYSMELVQALGQLVDLTVITVANSKIEAPWCRHFLPLMPSFGAAISPWTKLKGMVLAYHATIRECMRSPRHTILHIQFFRFAVLEALMFAGLQCLGVKVVFTAHNVLPHERKWWHAPLYRWWYGRVDAIHVLSRNVELGLRALVGAGRIAPIRRVPHGPYTRMRERYGNVTKQQARLQLGIKAEDFVVLQFGLLRPYKGAGRLIAAVAQLKHEAGLHTILAGGGAPAYLNELRQAAAEASDLAKVEIREGFLPDEQLCMLLVAADLAVFPYIDISQSGALYMAMSFGCLSLCSDISGFRECLPTGCEELLVDTSDERAFAQRILAFSRDAELYARLNASMKAYAGGEFNWLHIAHRTKDVYSELDSEESQTDLM